MQRCVRLAGDVAHFARGTPEGAQGGVMDSKSDEVTQPVFVPSVERSTIESGGMVKPISSSRQQAEGPPLPGPPVAATPRVGPSPVSFGQQRLWFVAQM